METIYPSQFYVWITCLLPSYQDTIIAGLVKKGYHVGAAAEDGTLTLFNESNAASLLTIKVESSDENLIANNVYEDVREIVDSNNLFIYSVVVSACTNCCWMGSNIALPKNVPVAPPPLPNSNKNNLN